MKTFELSERVSNLGERAFKVILHEIYPDSCVVNEAGTLYNRNGITWLRNFCERALPSLIDKSITAEFLDDRKTELHAHGQTGYTDGVPVFEDAEIIGHFKKAYIQEIEKEDGSIGTFAVGEGVIDEFRYKNLCDKLDFELSQNFAPKGSIEIFKKPENDTIIYQYGYKTNGRIPMEFDYSGYALLGVTPADDQARLLELNNEEESCQMDEKMMKELITSTVEELNNYNASMTAAAAEKNAMEDDYKAKIKDLEDKIDALEDELETCKNKCAEAEAKCKAAEDEVAACKKKEQCAADELNEMKIEKCKANLVAALKDFSEEEKAYASSEIETFNANPLESDISVVTNKIYAGIGMNAKIKAAEVAATELNAANEEVINIFGDMDEVPAANDVDIF